MKNLLLSFIALFNYAAHAQGLQYSIEPVFYKDNIRLRVTVTFEGEKSGVTFFGFENTQFGEPDQMNFLQIPVQKDGVEVQKQPDSNRIVVKHQSGKKMKFTYEVLDLQGTEAFYTYCCYKPILKSDYFHIQSGHLLLSPSEYWKSPNDQKSVRINWEKFPPNWTLHNSFGVDLQQIATLTNSQFTSAIFVGGDFRRYKFEVEKQPVYFLTRGKWMNLQEDSLVSILKSVVQGHRDFWKDHSDTIYTVTFLPVDGATWSDTSKFLSYGGSGLTNSFLSFATNNPGLELTMIRYVYVHELMHRWIGGKIENAAEEQQYWFSEGFTEYFTLKNSLRYGLIDVKEFLQNFNQDFMQAHYISPMKAMPNDSMNYTNFWSGNKDWEKLPYRRGCLYAFYLDNQLRENTLGKVNLDFVMREILTEIDKNPAQKLDHPFFLKIIKKHLGKRGKKDFNRFIEKGTPIDFEKTLLPIGLECQKKDVKYSFGPSKDVIMGTKEFKDVPTILIKDGVDFARLKVEILK
jgi:predicted metalloprotease with PDZ domain